jgi:hypothetical protein
MRVWIDADACPSEVKELLYRAARRRGVRMTLVANQTIHIPKSKFIDQITVAAGMNVADRRIVELLQPGDLVVTADIPLAANVIAAQGFALDPRGELYAEHNIGVRLAVRNFNDERRGGGQVVKGPSGYSDKDRRAFANQLDRFLTRALLPPPDDTTGKPNAPPPKEEKGS